jgi:hypothetical protein
MSAQTQRTVTVASPRAMGASRPRTASDPYLARVLTAIALSSIAAGAINAAAAATVGRTAIDTLAFFVAAAAGQVVWGALALVRAPRWWLALGAAGNLVVAATWVVSRTIGLPVGTLAGRVLPIGFPDSLATALEVAVVVGGALLLVRAVPPRRSCWWSAHSLSPAYWHRPARSARRQTVTSQAAEASLRTAAAMATEEH